MKLALIDDDIAVRENLRKLLSMYIPGVQVVAEAEGVTSGLECLRQNEIDLLLLDVEMKDGTGFDLLSLYGDLNFQVVFVTAHDAYAIKAFKFSAIDYILKPVDPDDLIKALKKVNVGNSKIDESLKVNTLIENKKANSHDQKLVLRDSENIYLISVKDIIRLESDGNYTKFYISDRRVIIISKTLKEYDNMLSEDGFFRAHQSHLINLGHFDRYEKKDGGVVHMKDDSSLPVAIRKKERLFEALKKYSRSNY